MKLVALGMVAVVLTLAVLLGLALVRTRAPDDAGQEFAGWEATIVGGEVRIPED